MKRERQEMQDNKKNETSKKSMRIERKIPEKQKGEKTYFRKAKIGI